MELVASYPRCSISFKQLEAFSYRRIDRSNSIASSFCSEKSGGTRRAETICRISPTINASGTTHSANSAALNAIRYASAFEAPSIYTTPPCPARDQRPHTRQSSFVEEQPRPTSWQNPGKSLSSNEPYRACRYQGCADKRCRITAGWEN